MPDRFDELSSALALLEKGDLRSALNHALSRAKLRSTLVTGTAPASIADFGLEIQIDDSQPIERENGIRTLMMKLRDQDLENYTLARFLIALKPRLAHRRDVQEAIANLFNRLCFLFKPRSVIYDFPFFRKNPFIDREALREKLYELFEDPQDENRLLVIRDDGFGKTHCRWLVQGVTKEIWGIEPIYLDLLEFAAEASGADGFGPFKALCHRFAAELGLTAEFDATFLNTPLRQAQQFSSWLVGVIRKQHRAPAPRQVVMFDHLAKDGVSSELRSLAIHFARRARDGELGNVYIVLLECDKLTADGLVTEGGGACEDTPGIIVKVHVDCFLAQVSLIRSRHGRQSSVPDEVRSFVDSLAYPLDRKALTQLCSRLRQWQIYG